jgi:hypothetical protein
MVYKGKDSDFVEPQVLKIAERIRQQTERALPQVVTQYFAGMHRHLTSANSILTSGGKAIYVIGDSWIKDVYVPTHKILARMSKKAGFKSVSLSFMRNRRDPYKRGLAEYLLILSN